MRRGSLVMGFVTALSVAGVSSATLGGCDNKKEPDLGLPKTKGINDLKQSSKNEMSPEELAAARKEAGFKSHEEQVAEAKAAYEKMEKGYVKGRLDAYRALLKKMRGSLEAIEKAAAGWAKAKKPDKVFEAWNEKNKEDMKAFLADYDALTEKGSRGGDLQVALDKAVQDWEALVDRLAPDVAAAEPPLETAVADIGKEIDAVETMLGDIEKDETIEPEEPEGDGGKGKAGDDGKAEAKADTKSDDKGAG